MLLASGMLANFFPAFLFAIAQTRIDSSIAGVLNALTPLITILVGSMFFSYEFKNKQLLGLFIAFAGCIVLSLVDSSGELSINFYVIFVVIATVLYGFNANILKYYTKGIPSLKIASVALIVPGVLSASYLATTDFVELTESNPNAYASLGYLAILGIVGTSMAFVFFSYLIKITSATFASFVTYIIPIVAVCWGIYDGEQIGIYHVFSFIAIFIGVYLGKGS